MSEGEIWVVKHERYEAPTYVRLYGPFSSGQEASTWATEANLPDFWVGLRVVPPDELQAVIAQLVGNGQLTPAGRSLNGASDDEWSAIAGWAEDEGQPQTG